MARNPIPWLQLQFRAIGISVAATLLILTLYGPRQAHSSVRIFTLYTSICITVYEIKETFNSALRDDLAEAIAPRLDERANALMKGLHVAPRTQCIRRDDAQFERQAMMDLHVTRQQVPFEGAGLSIATVAGSSPNVMMWLAPYALTPVTIVDRSHIDDRRIEDALIRFFDSTVLAVLRQGK